MWEPIVQGKTIMITGGTAGIGLVAARELAAKGAAVVIVGRDAAKGSRAVADIGRQTGNDRVHFVRADLSSQAEVRREIGSASCRERVCQYVEISGVAGALKKNKRKNKKG